MAVTAEQKKQVMDRAAQLQARTPGIPATAPADQIPAFERDKVGTINQQVDAPSNDGVNAFVRPMSSTVHVTNAAEYNGGTPQHEYTHVYEGKVQPIAQTLMSGGNGATQDYGGTSGLEQRNAQGQTISSMNPEQRAEAVGDSWAAQKKVVADAKSGKLSPGELGAFDRVKAAFHPMLQQMKNEGDATIDTHPAAPGLPPASVSGIIAPDPLLGGEWALAPSATHYVAPGNGQPISRPVAEQYMDRAGDDPARARAMASHDNHTF